MKAIDMIKFLFFEGDDENTTIWFVGVIIVVMMEYMMSVIKISDTYTLSLWWKCADIASVMCIALLGTLTIRFVKNSIDLLEMDEIGW